MVKTPLTFTIAALAFLATGGLVQSAPAAIVPRAASGQTAALISAEQMCLFLPPKFGGGISESEDVAVAFCKSAIPTAPNARILPQGFVQSAHFVQNTQKSYVQVTGRIDRSKYGLSASDGGGQNDIKAPVGSHCAGYNYYVQFIEPDAQIYCLRCCKTKTDCPVNKSTYGCKKVLGGDYS